VGDPLRAGKPYWCVASHLCQLSLLPSVRWQKEYQHELSNNNNKWQQWVYSVSQKIPPRLLKIFPKRLGIFNQFLHTYYAIIYTLGYEFLFKYLQL